MRRLLVLAYLMSVASTIGTARADTVPRPICTRDEVVARVAQKVRWNAPYATLLPRTIAERPGPDNNVVLCAVTLVERNFDTVRYRSEAWSETQQYSVRRLHAGYEVTMGAIR